MRNSITNEQEVKYGKTINIEKYDVTEFEKEHMPYTMICNEVIQNAENVSAVFMWIYLQSMPPHWVPNKTHLMNHFKISKRTYERHMSYLASCNLISYVRNRNANGTLGAVRLIVKNGSKYKLALDSAHTAKIGVVDFNHTAKKPHCGETTAVACDAHINTTTTTKEILYTKVVDDFALEKVLYTDSEQQRKAIYFRKSCLNDKRCREKHSKLLESGLELSYEEILDECVSYYASQAIVQLVSPQRLLSWIGRSERHALSKTFTKYPSKHERAKENEKITAREKESAERKYHEIKDSKKFSDIVNKAHEKNGEAYTIARKSIFKSVRGIL